ncbi:location of vulva defective 1-like isoform X3 [Tribolium madens]|uniref:location of vulva defective 1-like isoform X3 n=1 Tax=Tribolium madens TaxID=41895 RepID=UPI001CF75352|nr:location of vulva defective 1-like isoform X3 [Tribolium madens]
MNAFAYAFASIFFLSIVICYDRVDISNMTRDQLSKLVAKDTLPHRVRFTNCNEVNIRHDKEISVRSEWIEENDKDAVKEYIFNFFFHDGIYIKPKVDIFEDHLEIPAYSLTPRKYLVAISANKKPNSLRKDLPENVFGESGYLLCWLNLKAYEPVAIIEGGVNRVVDSSSDINVDGSSSYDKNFQNKSQEGLTYSWTCTQTLKPPTFCKNEIISTESRITIPKKFVEKGETFMITLVLKSKYGPVVTEHQTITVKKDVANLNIICKRNCPPEIEKSSPKEDSFLTVTCSQNCDNIDEEKDYLWTIKSKTDPNFSFDYAKNTRFGRTGTKFVIEANVLKADTYTISVNLNPKSKREGVASLEIEFGEMKGVKSCSIEPKTGDSLLTEFRLNCIQVSEKDRFMYELYTRNKKDPSKEQLVIDGYSPAIFNEKFVLPSSNDTNYFVKVMKEGQPKLEIQLDVEVKSSLKDKSTGEVVDVVKDIYQDQKLSDLTSSVDPEVRQKGLQLFQTLVDEVISKEPKDKKMQNFIRDLKLQAAKDLANSPVNSINEVLQVSNTITNLHIKAKNQTLPAADPELAQATTEICKTMSIKFLDLLKKEKYPLSLSDKSLQQSRIISKCVDTYANANYSLLTPIEYNVTKEVETPIEETVTETYENYLDYDDKYFQNMQNLKQASIRSLKASSNSAKSIALTRAVGEGIFRMNGTINSLVVLKDEGKYLVNMAVTSHGVVLIPPEEFRNDSHPYDILLITWERDILWWNPGHTHIDTDIAKVEFWHSTCKQRISTFKKPVNIFFKLKFDGTNILNTLHDSYEVDEKFDIMTSFNKNYLIKVYRIALPGLRILHHKFYNVTKANSLKRIVSFHYPSINSFTKSMPFISEVGRQFYTRNLNNYDVWIYFGIVAVNGFAGQTIDFSVEWYASSCLKWKENTTTWEAGCLPGGQTNTTTIHCQCTNFSLLAGYLENFPIEQQKVMPANIEIKLISCYIIFITVCVTYILFYILIFFTLRERKKKQLYFLADNNLQHPFAYLLLIKTGLGYNAGTSSNVVIKLVGSKKSSEPHVLNFPDPKLQLLQSFGNDMFVLTTENHLGEIKKVELWFDSIGPNASWHCRNILVYDMQLRTEWQFINKTDLSVRKGTTRITVTPEEKTKKTGYLSRIHIQFFTQRYHTWCLFRYEEHLSFLKKLTIILSNVLTTYVSVLLFDRLPRFHMSDSIGHRHTYIINAYDVFKAFVGSFPSFIFHMGIAWLFRNTQRQFSRYRYTRKLPVPVNFTLWGVLIALILFSTSFLVVVGFWIQFYSSCVWLTSCMIGLIFGITIYETLCSMLLNIFFKMELGHNIEKMFNDIKDAINVQRAYLYQHFGILGLRPYFSHLYKPLKVRDVMVKRLLLKRRLSIIAELEDLLMFTIYITILYVIILANKDILMIYGKREMSEIVEGFFTRTLKFSEIDEGNDIIRYLNETLLPAIHPTRWYGSYVITEPALVVDVLNKLVGVVRIRQQRMMPHLCEVAKEMRFLNMSCWPEFSRSKIETKTHGYGWGKYLPFMAYDRLRGMWKYKPDSETETLPHIGQFAIYSGGGYIMYLGRNFYNSYVNLRKMIDKYWIDPETRVIFIEFLCYNQNYNIFNAVKLLFEQSATGFIKRSVYVYSVRMLFVGNEVEMFSFVFFTLFIIWVAIMLIKQTVTTLTNFRSVFKDIWFLIDSVIVIMSVLSISLFIFRTYMVGSYMKQLDIVQHNEFVNYFYLFYIEDILNYVAGFLVCIATIRLWKFLRFASMFRKLELTFEIAGNTFMSFAVAFFLLLFTFATAIYMVMGSYFEKVYTVARAARIMTTLALKPLEMELDRFLENNVATAYITFYMIVIQLLMFILIMIIVMAYIEAQLQIASEIFKYNIYDYMEERMKYIPMYLKYKFKKRARAGFDGMLKVAPKPDKIIYLFCKIVTHNRMMGMKNLTQCIVRNKNKKKTSVLSEYDSRLMLQVCRSVLIKPPVQEVEVFYKGRMQGQRLKFVDERKVEKIANIVNLMLQEKLPEFSHTRDLDATVQKCTQFITQGQQTLQRCNLGLKLILHNWYTVEEKFRKTVKR